MVFMVTFTMVMLMMLVRMQSISVSIGVGVTLTFGVTREFLVGLYGIEPELFQILKSRLIVRAFYIVVTDSKR